MRASSVITLLLSLVLVVSAAEKTKSKDSSKSKGKASDKTEAKSDSPLDSISAMIPEGVKNSKVKIPGFDQGRPSSLVTADTMTRNNKDEMFAEGVVIHLYGKKPDDNMRVDMKTATYHLDTKILVSKERSKVTRPTMTVEGDSLEYNTETTAGVMKGNVHMVIHSKPKPKPQETPKPEAASAEAAAPNPVNAKP